MTEGHTLFLVCFHHADLGVDLLGVSLLYFVAANHAVNLAACSSCAVKTPGYKVSVCKLEDLSVRAEQRRDCRTECGSDTSFSSCFCLRNYPNLYMEWLLSSLMGNSGSQQVLWTVAHTMFVCITSSLLELFLVPEHL